MRRSLLAFSTLLVACASAPAPVPPSLGEAVGVARSESLEPVPFLRDDLDTALAEARRSGRLLFVDAWAPWCHTCLSMRHEVLSRPELGAFANRYVFLELDTDRPEASRFVERYAQKVWPTFFVLDPRDGAVLAMHGGGASLGQLATLLEQAARRDASPGDSALRRAHDAAARGDFASAAALYREATAKVGDARRVEALLGSLRSMSAAKEHAGCVELARAELRTPTEGSAPGDLVYYLAHCAEGLEPGTGRDEALELVERRLGELVASPAKGASVDDRADVAAMLAERLRARGAVDEARRVETERLGWLEAAARAAPSPEAAAVHDYARMNAYLALGRADEAIAMLDERTKQLPDRYEPFARLGQALLSAGRARDALVPIERAIALAYGPRKLRYLAMRVRALEAVGDLEALRAALVAERDAWRAVDPARVDRARLDVVEKRIAELDGTAPP